MKKVEEIVVEECLSFDAESFVFHFTVRNVKIKIYRNIIVPIVLYGCETWSLRVREERRLRVFENRVLRKIFGPKRDEGTREWRRLYDELFDIYVSPKIIQAIKSRKVRGQCM